ncbi:MAG: hypothetical protein K8H88_27775, partial [Sandaracinaceae bacterium]|nr:hypothetical protein [Sandaracinaceae bacterium]
YGGAFKVTKGLSTAFPDRVLTTPISEAGFTGVAVGMAMRGLRPIVEIMFGDFLTLAADQLLNHATKYPWMYEGKASVPLVVRAADLTIVAYGGMAELAVQAAERLLIEDEVVCEVVLPSSLTSIDLEPLRGSLGRTGRLLVAEESAPTASWGSELIARVATELYGSLRAAPVKDSARDTPIANTRTLEDAILPGEDDLVSGARRALARPAMRLVKG